MRSEAVLIRCYQLIGPQNDRKNIGLEKNCEAAAREHIYELFTAGFLEGFCFFFFSPAAAVCDNNDTALATAPRFTVSLAPSSSRPTVTTDSRAKTYLESGVPQKCPTDSYLVHGGIFMQLNIKTTQEEEDWLSGWIWSSYLNVSCPDK